MFKYAFSISILIFFVQLVYADTDRDYIADLISTQGTVETLPADSRDWIPAMDFQKLYPKDTIRTRELSRAAILFIDHTLSRHSGSTEVYRLFNKGLLEV